MLFPEQMLRLAHRFDILRREHLIDRENRVAKQISNDLNNKGLNKSERI